MPEGYMGKRKGCRNPPRRRFLFSNEVRFKGVNLAPKEKTCYTRTSPNFNFLVFFEFLIEFLVGFLTDPN